jgi:cytochrome c oxidase subunit II
MRAIGLIRAGSLMLPRRAQDLLNGSRLGAAALAVMLSGCSEIQSVLAPQSVEAARTKDLADLLFVGGAIILVVVIALTVAALFGTAAIRSRLAQGSTVLLGGIVFPAVTLTALLVYGLTIMRSPGSGATNPLEIDVQGERWWWRVTYVDQHDQQIAAANEIHISLNKPVRIRLTTADVIHSFWVPRLAGKVDMIPGRTNLLQFQPTSAGEFRGQCAEYCGGAHALMGMRVIALPQAEFEAWFRHQQQPAVTPSRPLEQRGRDLFLQRGCGACHTIRGIGAVGTVGPDLTHIGGRRAIAAETLPMTEENLVRWVAHNEQVKPSSLMPSYSSLPEEELQAIASYLFSLK